MLPQRGVILLPLLCLLSQPAISATSDREIIEALQAQVAALTDRLEALEARGAIQTQHYTEPQVNPAPPPSSSPASWTDSIKLSGDFRYRHESFEIENQTDRHRHRIRARSSLTALIDDNVEVGFGLASGSDDPLSTNQTLDRGASTKNVAIDLAYVAWQTPTDGLSVLAGKFKNPLHRAGGNGLVWDGDLRPEGIGVQFDNGTLFSNVTAMWVDESSGGEDALMLGTQIGMRRSWGDGELLGGVGYLHYTDAKDRAVFFNIDPQGNRTNPDGTYLSDFRLLEAFVEYQMTIGNGYRLSWFADHVTNTAADDYETAWAVGLRLREGNWGLRWVYENIEADSVVGTFSDSDFIGGGTDGSGHVLTADYAVTRQIALRGTLFLSKRNMDFGMEEDYRRLQLDVSFKY